MRNIVNGNESLNVALNAIVDNELNKTIDEMIAVVKAWKKNTMVVSCDTILYLLKINKAK